MVILIGGSSSVGKSRVAADLARKHGLQHLQVDSLRAQVPYPAVHFVGARENWKLGPERLRDRLIEMSAVLRPYILELVTAQLEAKVPSVIEGEGIEPVLKESFDDAAVRLIFVVELDEARLAKTLANRPTASTSRFRELSVGEQRCVFRMNRLYGEWILEEAQRRALPCLPSQPWKSLADRVFAAAARTTPPTGSLPLSRK